MSMEHFPYRREDGTFSVAIQYAVRDTDVVSAVEAIVGQWEYRKSAVDHVDIASELTTSPTIVADSSGLQVQFEFASTAFLWKGLLVELVGELQAVNGIERIGIQDVVAGVVHPASISGLR